MVTVKQLHESLNRLYEDYEKDELDLIYDIASKAFTEKYKVDIEENNTNRWGTTTYIVTFKFDDGYIVPVKITSKDCEDLRNLQDIFFYTVNEALDDDEWENGSPTWDTYDWLDESLTEARNPENDEVNDVIRRNIGKRLKDISPEDRELLANNGVSISGGKDNRTYSIKDNRSMTFDKNGRTKEYSTHGLRKPSLPDINNPDFDLKGWLSPNEKELKRLHGAQYKPLDHYKRLKSYADDAEKRGRRYRKDLEAQAQNSILDNDDYYPRIDYESRDRAIRGDYEWADRLNNKAKKVASDAKSRSKYYKNESLIREGFAPSEVQTQYVEALEDLEEWLEDGEIDLEDILLYFIPDRNIYTVLKLHEYIKSDIEEEY